MRLCSDNPHTHTHTRTAHTPAHTLTHSHIRIFTFSSFAGSGDAIGIFYASAILSRANTLPPFLPPPCARYVTPDLSRPSLTSHIIRHCQFTWHVNNQQHTHAHTLCTHVSLLACLTCCPRCRCRRFSSCSSALQLLSVAEAAAASSSALFHFLFFFIVIH